MALDLPHKQRVASALFTFLVLFGFLGTGCVRRYTEGPPKIVLWHNEDASTIPFINSVIEAFEAEHPGEIQVEQVHYDVEGIHQQYLTASIAGSGPDLVYTQEDKAGVFVVGQFIHPLETLVPINDYVPVSVQAVSEGGHVWGIPVSTGNHLMLFYNKKLAATPPLTTDDFIAQCQKVMREHHGTYGFATDTLEPFFFIPFLSSFGGWPMKGRSVTLNTPEMKKALLYFRSLIDQYKILPRECDYNCMDGLFKEGRVAFIMNGDWAIDSYRKMLGDDFAIATLPINSQTKLPLSPLVSGKYLMINSNTQGTQLDWAVKFAKFYTNEANQLRQFQKLGRLPGLASAFKKAQKTSSPLMKASFDQLLLGKPAPMYVEMRAVWDALRTQKGNFMTGQKTADEAMGYMQTAAERKVEEMQIR